MAKPITVWSYLPEYKKEKKSILAAVQKVFASGQLILGAQGKKFEAEFASYCDRRYGVGVNSGTDAIFLALKALGIGAGDEVITVPNTAIPTVSAICATGATPRFVDIDPTTYLMDVDQIEKHITKKTKIIIPVHLYGQCVNMDRVSAIAKKHKLLVLEDCAQSTGAKWNGKVAGSMSDIASFSFYPTKVLGAYGDAGMIITDSEEIAKKLKMLRMYGISSEYYSEFLGFNSRLDEVQAAILSLKLRKIKTYIKKRKQIAARYDKALRDTPLQLPKVDPKADHPYYLYVCAHPKRDKIIEHLKAHNILVNVSYKHPLHTMRGFSFLGYKKGQYPNTEKASSEIFSIPIYPELTLAQQNKVIATLKKFFAA